MLRLPPAPIQVRGPQELIRLRIGLVSNRTGNREKAVIPAKLERFDSDRVACPIVSDFQGAAIDRRGMLFIKGRKIWLLPNSISASALRSFPPWLMSKRASPPTGKSTSLMGSTGCKAAPECARNDVVHGRRNGVELFPRAIDCAERSSSCCLVAPKRDLPAQGPGAASVVQLDMQVGNLPG